MTAPLRSPMSFGFWIPAFAGMTQGDVGMTKEQARNCSSCSACFNMAQEDRGMMQGDMGMMVLHRSLFCTDLCLLDGLRFLAIAQHLD